MPQLDENWKLLKRTEEKYGRYKLFKEYWVHDESSSGIFFFSTIHQGDKKFVVEGFGIGTVNIINFDIKEKDIPLQRWVCLTEKGGREELIKLQERNIKIWKRKLGLEWRH